MNFSLFCNNCHAYIGTELAICQECGAEREVGLNPRKPGEIFWESKIGGTGRGKPIISDNLVIFTWGNRRDHSGVTSVNRYTGEQIWNYNSETTCEAGPVLMGERLYFATLSYVTGARLCCLEAASGKELWQKALPDSAWSLPVVQDGRVFVGTSNGQIFGFSSDSGELLPHYPIEFLKGRMWLTPINENQFAALSEFGSIQIFTAMQLVGGWHQPVKVPGFISSPPTLYEGNLYFGLSSNTSDREPTLADGNLVELNIKKGSFQVISRNLTKVTAAPCLNEGVLYTAGRDHLLHAIDIRTRKELWSGAAEHSFSGKPELHEGLVIIGSHDGSIYAFASDPEAERFLSGEQKTRPVWRYCTKNASRILGSVLCKGEACYISCEDGRILALPYSLGEFGWIASRMERLTQKMVQNHEITSVIKQSQLKTGHALALASCFESPENQELFCKKAGKYWKQANEPEWLARLYKGRRELTKAAKAYEDSAEYQRGRNRLKSAEDYYEAAKIYWKLGEFDIYSRCQREACFLGSWPLINLEWRNQGYLQQLEKSEFTIRAKNVGYGDIQTLGFKLGGSLLKFIEFKVNESIEQDSWLDLTLEIVPTQQDSNLIIEVEYAIGSHKLPFTSEFRKRIIAFPPKQKITMGDVVKGSVRIYNPSGQPIDLDIGDSILSTVEIVMGDKLV
jgi:outer membrane protein assembly factor BamB